MEVFKFSYAQIYEVRKYILWNPEMTLNLIIISQAFLSVYWNERYISVKKDL